MRAWLNPLPLALVPTNDANSFHSMSPSATGLPILGHPGAFSAMRRHHVHEGVDLYCAHGTAVTAVEDGQVVAVMPFTGPNANLPWWLDTEVVLVEGASGVVAYGEIVPKVVSGQMLQAGELVGHVTQVLRNDKGRPTSMLHLELHEVGTRQCPEWTGVRGRPQTLKDPTPFLLGCCASSLTQVN